MIQDKMEMGENMERKGRVIGGGSIITLKVTSMRLAMPKGWPLLSHLSFPALSFLLLFCKKVVKEKMIDGAKNERTVLSKICVLG